MRYALVLTSALALLLSACGGDVHLTGPDLLEDAEDEHPEFDSATLAVHSPVSADILFLEEPVMLDAEILDEDGNPMDFDEIVWELNDEFDPIHVGSFGEVEIDWGIHEFIVTADLPNGDRLQTVIGGVRVQGRHSGIYSGNFQMNIDAEFQGTPVTASCLGGLDFVIDMSGENITGENGACTINLFVLGEFDVNYAVDGAVGDDDVEGDVQIDLGLFDVPVGWEGEIDEGEMFADFAGTAILFDFNGAIEAHRVSLYVEE